MKTKKIDYGRWLLVLPALIVVGTLLVYPIFSSLYYSLTTKHLIKATYDFIGFDNYIKVLTDPDFFKAFLTSILWTVASESPEGGIQDSDDHTVGVPVYRNRIGLEVDS